MQISFGLFSIGIVFMMSIGLIINHSFGQQITLDLTAPTISELYGGEKQGSLTIDVQNNTLSLTAVMDPTRQELQTYEGWLEDKGDASGYSLSLGKFDDDNSLRINQTMVNPYTYTIFYVTSEPVNDPDPNPSDIVATAKLPLPFGQ
ncbi:MAG: hypothetical protein MRJ93_10580 [Nitrososphaeraceae archaeon]|nr:hypothetical protein [Nitrososphaeraceae archaeon]